MLPATDNISPYPQIVLQKYKIDLLLNLLRRYVILLYYMFGQFL